MDGRRGSRAGSVDVAAELPSVEDLSRITKKLVAAIDDQQIHDGVLPPAVTAYFQSMMKLANDFVRDQVLIRKQPIDEVMARCVGHIQGFINNGDHFSALAFYQALNVDAYQAVLNKQLANNSVVADFIKQYAPSSDPQVDYNKNYRLYENNGDPVTAKEQAERAKVIVPYINHFVTISDRVKTKIRENERSVSNAQALGKLDVANKATDANEELEQSLSSLVSTFADYREKICISLTVAPEFPKQILLTGRQEAQLASMTTSISPELEQEAKNLKAAFNDYLKNKDQPNAEVKMFFALGHYMREMLGDDFARLQAMANKYDSITKMLCDRKKLPYLSVAQITEHCNALPPGERGVMSNLLMIVSKFNPATLRQSADFEDQFNTLLKQVNQNLDAYRNVLKSEDIKKVAAVIAGKEGLSGLVDKVRASRAGSLSSPIVSRRGSEATPTSSLEDTQSVDKSKSSKGKSVLEVLRRDSVTFFSQKRSSSRVDVEDAQQAKKTNAMKVMVNDLNMLLQAGDRYNGGIAGAVNGFFVATNLADKEKLPQPIQNIVDLFANYLKDNPKNYALSLMGFDNAHQAERDELARVYNSALDYLADYANELGLSDMKFPRHLYSDANMLERVEHNIEKFNLGMTETKDPKIFVTQMLADIKASNLTNGQKHEALDLVYSSFSKLIDNQASQAIAKDLRDQKQALSVAEAKEALDSKARTVVGRKYEAAMRDIERKNEQEVLKQQGKGWVRATRPTEANKSALSDSPGAKLAQSSSSEAKLKENAQSESPVVAAKVRPVPPPKPPKKNEAPSTAEMLQGLAHGNSEKAVEDAKVASAAARAAEVTAQKMNSGVMARRRDVAPRQNEPAAPAATEEAESKQTTPSMRKGSGSD